MSVLPVVAASITSTRCVKRAAMPSQNLRRFNSVIVKAELAGLSNYAGPPCKADPQHVEEDGTTTRDTIRRTCNLCENDKRGAYAARQVAH